MSVSIVWSPSSAGRYLEHGSNSDYEALGATFGSPPWELQEADAKILRAMGVAAFNKDNVFNVLAKLVEKHGSIKVWGEW
jgi:hypothetical protein